MRCNTIVYASSPVHTTFSIIVFSLSTLVKANHLLSEQWPYDLNLVFLQSLLHCRRVSRLCLSLLSFSFLAHVFEAPSSACNHHRSVSSLQAFRDVQVSAHYTIVATANIGLVHT